MICGFCGVRMREYSNFKTGGEQFFWCCERCHSTRTPHLVKTKRPDFKNPAVLQQKNPYEHEIKAHLEK